MLSTLRAQYHISNLQCSITFKKAIPRDGCRVGGAAKCTAGMLGRDGTKGLVGCMVLSGECICTICRIHMYIHRSMLEWHLGARTVPVIAAHLHNARSGALRVQTPPSSIIQLELLCAVGLRR